MAKDGGSDLFGGLTATDRPEDTAPSDSGQESPIEVIPLDGSRDADGRWNLAIPPTSSAAGARKSLKQLRDAGELQLPDELIDRIAHSAVYPKDLEGIGVARLRTEHGWLLVLDVRLFTPLVNVSIANDRWVADAVYDADPSASGKENLRAVPMPMSDATYAALRYETPTAELLGAADQNFHRVLQVNRQDVGRRLIEQPVTLVATYVGDSGAGQDSVELAAVDGNCRISSAFSLLKVAVEWLPTQIRSQEAFRDLNKEDEVAITPALLANLSVNDRRKLVRNLVKSSTARLSLPPKPAGSHGSQTDIRERNRAASVINALTIPARVVVGFHDDDAQQYGMSRFASAVRALLVQMNVEPKPLDESARHSIEAEEIVQALREQGVIDESTYDVLIGRDNLIPAMEVVGLNPKLPDLRAALVLQVLCGTGEDVRAILRERLRKPQVHPSDRSRPAVELAIRSYTASLEPDELKQARTALETSAIWSDLVNKPWTVINIDSDEDVDLLEMYAHEQREAGGPLLRLLGVLGMLALVSTRNLLAPRGSAEQLVDGLPIDRGSVATIISKILRHDWGITLLADAIKRARKGERMRWIDPKGKLVDAPEGWQGRHFDANLRLAAKRDSAHEAVIPGGTQERYAWTAVASTVQAAKEKLIDYTDLRKKNGTTERLPWLEVESTISNLEMLNDNIKGMSEPRPLQ